MTDVTPANAKLNTGLILAVPQLHVRRVRDVVAACDIDGFINEPPAIDVEALKPPAISAEAMAPSSSNCLLRGLFVDRWCWAFNI